MNVILGLVIIAIPFFTIESTGAFWNNIVVGALIAILAAWNAYVAGAGPAEGARWPAAVNALLGLWLIASPFFFAATSGYFWGTLIAGAIVLVVALYNSWSASRAATPAV